MGLAWDLELQVRFLWMALARQVSAQQIEEGRTTPERALKRLNFFSGRVIYTGETANVRSPGGLLEPFQGPFKGLFRWRLRGVALDNYFVYWLNKAGAAEAGSLNRGLQYGTDLTLRNASLAVQTLASNALKCYGVCLAGENVFYSDESSKLRRRCFQKRRVYRDVQDDMVSTKSDVILSYYITIYLYIIQSLWND